jgi:C4-dicarboxylate-specific signal transduction histidine kinase
MPCSLKRSGIRNNALTDARSQTSLDVNNLIREAPALVRDELQTHRIAVQTDYSQSLPPIEGDQIQLQQLLVNLITNATDSGSAASPSASLEREPALACARLNC